MGRDDDAPEPDIEVLDVGARGAPGAGGAVRRWPWWLPVVIAAIVASLVLVVLIHPQSRPSASPTTQRIGLRRVHW